MTTIETTTNGMTQPTPATKTKRKPASKPKAKAKAAPKRAAKRKAKPSKRTKAGERGKMAKAGDYAMVVRIPEALHKKMWAWAKKQDDSLSGLVRKAIERLLK